MKKWIVEYRNTKGENRGYLGYREDPQYEFILVEKGKDAVKFERKLDAIFAKNIYCKYDAFWIPHILEVGEVT